MSEKPGVMFFWEMFELFNLLSDDECKRMLLSIYEYARHNNLPDFSNDRALNFAWQTAKYRLDEDTKRYNNICDKRIEAGKKGAKNRWQNKQMVANIANAKNNSKHSQYNTTQYNSTQYNSTQLNPFNDICVQKKKKFVPPNLEDVKAYCAERKNNVSAEKFFDFYSANGWTQGKGKPIRDWKACVRLWERNEIITHPTKKQSDNPFLKFTGETL